MNAKAKRPAKVKELTNEDLRGVAVKIPRYLYLRFKAAAAAAGRQENWRHTPSTSVSRLVFEKLDPVTARRYHYAGRLGVRGWLVTQAKG